jgi:hypothetical protein
MLETKLDNGESNMNGYYENSIPLDLQSNTKTEEEMKINHAYDYQKIIFQYNLQELGIGESYQEK